MKKMINLVIAGALLAIPVLVYSAVGDGGAMEVGADGFFSVTPVLERSCIAVQIPLTARQALVGVHWYNNDGDIAFPKLLVASGQANVPPIYDDGIVVASDFFGEQGAWSQVLFDEPVASTSGALYVIFQLPAFEGDRGGDNGTGIGYKHTDDQRSVFLSADGDEWVAFQAEFGLMVEPVFIQRDPGVIALSSSNPGKGETAAEVSPSRTVLGSVYPNPFNPSTFIEYSLKQPGAVLIQVFDLRGRHVNTLVQKTQKAGHFVVEWRGVDTSGARIASGVYFVRLEAGDIRANKRVVLVK